jgi:hypothetical protein
VTAAKTGEIEKYIQPPSGTKEIEQHLRKNHRLEYGLAQVRYLFDPDFFRRDAIDFQKLVQSLSQKYELEFQMPEMVKIAVHQQAKDPGAATPTRNDRLKEALLSPEGLVFLDGLLKYQDKGDDIERAIRIVNVHSQNLTVTVDGATREAEFVGEKIACDLLESQQMKPQRDTFFRYVAGKQYSSTTTQRLGVPIDSIFSPAFRELIRKSIEDGVGWKAAVLPTPPKEKTREDFTVRCAFASPSIQDVYV